MGRFLLFQQVCITRHVIEHVCERMNNMKPAGGWVHLNISGNETDLKPIGSNVKVAHEVFVRAMAKPYHCKAKRCVVIENALVPPSDRCGV